MSEKPVQNPAIVKIPSESETLKDQVLASLDDLKANDVVCLKVADMTPLMDYMVVASGTSTRHVKSLVNHVIEDAKAAGVRPVGVEGTDLAEWILVDLNDVVVHIMLPKVREFYDLERLWMPMDRAKKEEQDGSLDE